MPSHSISQISMLTIGKQYQKIFIVDIDEYVFLVPFVEDDEGIFLKTIIPSRKMTKKYLGDKNENE